MELELFIFKTNNMAFKKEQKISLTIVLKSSIKLNLNVIIMNWNQGFYIRSK